MICDGAVIVNLEPAEASGYALLINSLRPVLCRGIMSSMTKNGGT